MISEALLLRLERARTTEMEVNGNLKGDQGLTSSR